MLTSAVTGFSRSFDDRGQEVCNLCVGYGRVYGDFGARVVRRRASDAKPIRSATLATVIKSAGEPVTGTLSSGLFGTLHATTSIDHRSL